MATPVRQAKLLHFDSIYANYLTNPTSGVTTLSPYFSSFPLNAPISKVKRLSLKSMEIPVAFSNVRTGSTNTLTLVLNGTTYTVTLAQKLYTTIAALLTDINAAWVAAATPYTVTYAVSSNLATPYRLTITTTAPSWQVVNTNLSRYMLGFKATDVAVGGTVTASGNYNLNVDNYLNMFITNISCPNPNQSGVVTTFKIPLNASNNSIFYYLENGGFKQSVDINDTNLVLNQLTVYIKDRFNNEIDYQGGDYSFSLEIEFEGT